MVALFDEMDMWDRQLRIATHYRNHGNRYIITETPVDQKPWLVAPVYEWLTSCFSETNAQTVFWRDFRPFYESKAAIYSQPV